MVTEDNLDKYEKTQEQTQEQGLDKIYDLENKEDLEKLESEMTSDNFFTLEEGVSYKVKLTSSQVREVQKQFGEETVTKYEINVQAKGSDGSTFEGLWQVGKSILSPIMKQYEPGAVFNVSRTGTGKKTKYSVSKDF